MKYRDYVRVTRVNKDAPVVEDPETGITTPAPPILVYEGPARVQAGGLIRANRRATGDTFAQADGAFWVPPRRRGEIMNVEPEDDVAVAYATRRVRDEVVEFGADAVATMVLPEDGSVLMRYR